VENGQVKIKFKQLGGGLALSSGDQPLGFAVAGADKNYSWAKATVEGDTVVLSAEVVASPKFVRYAWVNNPPGNLGNREGLPVAPFQTELK
jgi:sialate O-acetylesterase